MGFIMWVGKVTAYNHLLSHLLPEENIINECMYTHTLLKKKGGPATTECPYFRTSELTFFVKEADSGRLYCLVA